MERYRTTLILVGVLVLLGAWAILSSNNATAPGGSATPTPTVFVWQEDNPVSAIEVVSGTSRVLVRKDTASGAWALEAPVQDQADGFQINSVADNLQRLQATRELTAVADLSQYGLAADALRVTTTFSDTAGTQRTLEIGSTTPGGDAYYVKRSDSEAVFLVGNFTLEPLRSWLQRPPVAPPTPTPLPTLPATASPALTTTLTVTGSATLTGALPVTDTLPGAANPTTPIAATPPAQVRPSP